MKKPTSAQICWGSFQEAEMLNPLNAEAFLKLVKEHGGIQNELGHVDFADGSSYDCNPSDGDQGKDDEFYANHECGHQ